MFHITRNILLVFVSFSHYDKLLQVVVHLLEVALHYFVVKVLLYLPIVKVLLVLRVHLFVILLVSFVLVHL